MKELYPGQTCTETGIWTPTNNPNFYDLEYLNRVMRRQFTAGEVMPRTPHGEPSWSLMGSQEIYPLEDLTGLSQEEIQVKQGSNSDAKAG